MNRTELSQLPKYRWMKSCIPPIDALATFVPHGSEQEAAIVGQSRWYPVEGGHRVLMPYEGQEYDASRFTLESGTWDHEHCKVCAERIFPMTLCYVTEPSEAYLLLCSSCFESHVISKQRPWWKFWR
jgi:hypothetical protein